MKTPTSLFAPLTLVSVLLGTNVAQAQTYQPSNRIPVADKTQIGTQVSGGNNNFNITGGLQRGQTLFHSFSDFSVPTSGQANFANPVGNRDIITRVTGGLFSDINGRIDTNNANFFLINPHGLVFGPNAQLNVGKAFVGSTANSIDLVDGSGRTITFGANPNRDAPLLSINPNVFFNVSRLNLGGGTGAIHNFGTLQTPNNSQYIGLIGGNVTLDGNAGGGKIIAPGGRVDIGGLNGAGSVSIDHNGLVFSSNGVGRSNVLIKNDAGIIVRATETLDTVDTFFNRATSNGSSINISANNIDILNSGAKLSEQTAALDAGLEKNSVQTKPAGAINIDAAGKVNLSSADIKNTLRSGAEGSIGDIKIQAGALDVKNNSIISTTTSGKGNAGNIDINVTGDINISGNNSSSTDLTIISNLSAITSSTYGQGDAGKITIDTQGKLTLANLGFLASDVGDTAVGNGQGIFITARELNLANLSFIRSSTIHSDQSTSKGNAGAINIKTTGDVNISGYDSSVTNPATAFSAIFSDAQGYGDAGKITIDTQGKLSVANQGAITSSIQDTAIGNSKGISITARELELANGTLISTSTFQTTQMNEKGNAGDINIKTTGDIKIIGYDLSSTNPTSSRISSSTLGQGDAGKITINTQGKLSIVNQGSISSSLGSTAVGNSQGISITARELEIANDSLISTSTTSKLERLSKGNAGDINIKTTGDIKIIGNDPLLTNNSTLVGSSSIQSATDGQGDAGKITIDTQGKLSLVNGGGINSNIGTNAIGNSKGISIIAREVALNNKSFISTGTNQTAQINGTGKSGDIDLQVKGSVSLTNIASIATRSTGVGEAGNVSLAASRVFFNAGGILSNSNSTSGGNVTLAISDGFLLRNGGFVTTNSGSTSKNGNGGNITISSPLMIALSGDNNITANANGGNGGNVKIVSQGLFGIQYRSQDSLFTNDITASSTFGQSGNVEISTPGTDPGRDKGELAAAPDDASKRISQACGESQRANKFYIIGKGGHPPNAEDPLTSEVVWRDPRGVKMQPAASVSTQTTKKLVSPAVGWVFDGKGKVTLIAAQTEGAPMGTTVVCPQEGK